MFLKCTALPCLPLALTRMHLEDRTCHCAPLTPLQRIPVSSLKIVITASIRQWIYCGRAMISTSMSIRDRGISDWSLMSWHDLGSQPIVLLWENTHYPVALPGGDKQAAVGDCGISHSVIGWPFVWGGRAGGGGVQKGTAIILLYFLLLLICYTIAVSHCRLEIFRNDKKLSELTDEYFMVHQLECLAVINKGGRWWRALVTAGPLMQDTFSSFACQYYCITPVPDLHRP